MEASHNIGAPYNPTVTLTCWTVVLYDFEIELKFPDTKSRFEIQCDTQCAEPTWLKFKKISAKGEVNFCDSLTVSIEKIQKLTIVNLRSSSPLACCLPETFDPWATYHLHFDQIYGLPSWKISNFSLMLSDHLRELLSPSIEAHAQLFQGIADAARKTPVQKRNDYHLENTILYRVKRLEHKQVRQLIDLFYGVHKALTLEEKEATPAAYQELDGILTLEDVKEIFLQDLVQRFEPEFLGIPLGTEEKIARVAATSFMDALKSLE